MSAPHSQTAHDALTLVLRLAVEDENTHAPETQLVMARWKPALDAMLAGKSRDEAIALVVSERGTIPVEPTEEELSAAWYITTQMHLTDKWGAGDIRRCQVALHAVIRIADAVAKNAAPQEHCKAGEFGCECGRPDTEPCPLPHLGAGRMSPTPKGSDEPIWRVRNAMAGRACRWERQEGIHNGAAVAEELRHWIDELDAALLPASHQRNAP